MKILFIGGSPRVDGNSDLLLRKCAAGAREQGAEADIVFARDLRVAGCNECYACEKDGQCCLKDDMQVLYGKYAEMDALVVVTPVFFYGVPAQLKAVIDRTQCCWERKYMLHEKSGKLKKGALITVGATRGDKLSECPSLTAKYYFDALEVEYLENLFVKKVDKKGEILTRPDELERAYQLGSRMAEQKNGV